MVRSKLEYASTVWSPYYLNAKYQIERVQNKFIKHMTYRNMNVVLESLEKRRKIADMSMIYKIINSKIDCQFLLENISFKVPSAGVRSNHLVYTPFSTTSYRMFSPIYRMSREMNAYIDEIPQLDPFHMPLQSFLKCIRKK